jgi:hypothetical protein
LGIVIAFNSLPYPNAQYPILITPLPIVIMLSGLLLKASFPINVTLSGIVIVVN